jgi:copper chaperone CopZ
MNVPKRVVAGGIALLVLGFALGADEAPVKVTIADMHICCSGCVKAIEKAATKVKDVTVAVDEDEATTTLTAPSYAVMQKAIDGIAKAGFYGKLKDKQVHFPPIKTADGKVQRLEITHVHNCCRGCAEALQEAVEGVDGVASNTIKSKQVSFVVDGDFVAKDVVQSLLDAGFYVTVK